MFLIVFTGCENTEIFTDNQLDITNFTGIE